VIGGAAAALLLPASPGAAFAALLAAIVVAAPNAWFAWRLARAAEGWTHLGAVDQARVTVAQSIQKLILMLLLMIGLFAWLRPEPLPFIGTLLLLHGAFFLTPLLETRGRRPAGPNEPY
jgi:F0F1-type ATP synthase assembly protein I